MLNKILLLCALSFPLAIHAQQTKELIPLKAELYTEACDSLQLMQHAIKKLSIVHNGERNADTDIYIGSPLVNEIDGRIELTCQDTLVVFYDMPEDEYGYYSSHMCIGQLNTNSPYAPFVVDVSYSEYDATMLINNITGDETFLYNNPILSPCKKYVVVFDKEPFNETDFQLSIYKDLNLIAIITYPLDNILLWNRQGIWNEDGAIMMPIGDWVQQPEFLKLEIDVEQLNSL